MDGDLARGTGFGKIAPSAQFQPEDPVGLLGARAQDDDGQARSRREAATGRQAAFARHHHVQDNEVDGIGGKDAIHRRGIRREMDRIALGAQASAEQGSYADIVVDDQDVGHVRNVIAVAWRQRARR